MIPESNHPLDSRIDATLRVIGTAAPPAGIEGRILTRLASERLQADSPATGVRWLSALRLRLSGAPIMALGFASAGLLCVVVVVGSVSYSTHLHNAAAPVPPVLPASSQGIGAASAVHPAAPATNPVIAGPVSRGRSARHARHGRAHVPRHARKAPGAVPVPSATPDDPSPQD